MFGLTPMLRSVNRLERPQNTFGGYDHRPGAGDGTIYDCLNMSADKYPLLTTRPRRSQYDYAATPNGMLVRDGLCWVDGEMLKVNGQKVAQVTDGRKVLCQIQDKLCIWPDKVIYDRTAGVLKPMEASWTGQAAFGDGTYVGEPALANTIRAEGNLTELFRAGDGVTVAVGDNTTLNPIEGPYIIRELEYDAETQRTELRFYEETWRKFVTESSNDSDGEMNSFPGVGIKTDITIRRNAPDLDLVFEHHNRLWGAKGSTVYACALGDPSNWQTFDRLSTDAYELVIGSPGEITGGCAYGGRPVFFKERSIVKIYGDGPTSWQTSEIQSLGVEAGSGKSLAVAGDVLFYKSTEGVMAYSGGYPRSAAEVFGGVRYRNATAGSDGVRYYVAMARAEDGGQEVFCYDTRYGLWHRESGKAIVDWGWDGELYAMEDTGILWRMGSARPGSEPDSEDEMVSFAEFSDWTDGTLRRKGPGKLLLRLEADAGVGLTIKVRYDGGEWLTVRQIHGSVKKQQFELPVQLRRCDHYSLRIEGAAEGYGGWTLHALTWERYTGSNRK